MHLYMGSKIPSGNATHIHRFVYKSAAQGLCSVYIDHFADEGGPEVARAVGGGGTEGSGDMDGILAYISRLHFKKVISDKCAQNAE